MPKIRYHPVRDLATLHGRGFPRPVLLLETKKWYLSFRFPRWAWGYQRLAWLGRSGWGMHLGFFYVSRMSPLPPESV